MSRVKFWNTYLNSTGSFENNKHIPFEHLPFISNLNIQIFLKFGTSIKPGLINRGQFLLFLGNNKDAYCVVKLEFVLQIFFFSKSKFSYIFYKEICFGDSVSSYHWQFALQHRQWFGLFSECRFPTTVLIGWASELGCIQNFAIWTWTSI